MLASFSTALVCWYRKDLFADPPPLAISRNLYSARRDAGVGQQVPGDEPVVGGGLGVVQDRPELAQVAGPQQVGDVAHALAGEQRQHFGIHLEKFSAQRPAAPDSLCRQQAVLRGVLPEGQQIGVGELGHRRRFLGGGGGGEGWGPSLWAGR